MGIWSRLSVINKEHNILSIILGGLAGAIVSAIYQSCTTESREQKALSIKLITDFLHMSDNWSNVLHLLDHPVLSTGTDESSKKNYNKIVQMGNWFDITAMLYWTNSLNRSLIIDAGIRDAMAQFVEKINSHYPELKPSESKWRNIRDVNNMHKYR
ncbi:MAG: hypothetical protein GKR93_14535 [Gammaproteobacteria bacterium]|nr:hypothetical protein [Gammaproteobacteria bacterium]